MITRVQESRKLTGLVLVGAGIAVLAFAGTLIAAVFGVGTDLIRDAIIAITTLGGSHQASQAASDRAKWNNSGGGGERGPPRV